ncbi:hypothetical protein [Sphingomonas sp. T9W2]|uniref:hypothetical protein n=1 Tax=Sphingomonas sp. T9W2 TaxID=3143183 RepID=UPI0031F5AD03
MLHWNDRSTWPFVPPGYYFLPEVFEAVGRKVFGDEWTGQERNPRQVEALPDPGVIYDFATYVLVDQEGDEITNWALYSKFKKRAALLVGLDPATCSFLTYAQWALAYERSLSEVSKAGEDEVRRIETFKILQRLASSGHLRFEVHNDQDGSMRPVASHIWNCRFDVVLPRFERSALSSNIAYAMAAPPQGSTSEDFWDSFTIDLFVRESILAEVLSNIYEQPFSDADAKADLTEVRANEILALAERRSKQAPATPTSSTNGPDGSSSSQQANLKTPFTDDIRSIVRECVIQRKGAVPTKKAIDTAFPGNHISRPRVRALHAEIWAEVYGDRPTVGANSRDALS